jgi:hypothetical protein
VRDWERYCPGPACAARTGPIGVTPSPKRARCRARKPVGGVLAPNRPSRGAAYAAGGGWIGSGGGLGGGLGFGGRAPRGGGLVKSIMAHTRYHDLDPVSDSGRTMHGRSARLQHGIEPLQAQSVRGEGSAQLAIARAVCWRHGAQREQRQVLSRLSVDGAERPSRRRALSALLAPGGWGSMGSGLRAVLAWLDRGHTALLERPAQ